MNELNNMLFSLLRSILCDEELDRSVIECLDEGKLDKLYKLSKKHDLAHLVSAALDKAGLLRENEISKKFGKQQLLAVYRYENLKYEYERICKTLEEGKIPYIPLKGAVLRDLYPEPWMRTSCDIDILVQKNDLESAVSLLVCDLNYEREEKLEAHDVSLHSGNGVHLELHFTIVESVESVEAILDSVWSYARKTEGEKYEMLPEFFVFYHIAHMLCHFLIGGCGIRPICDLYLIRQGIAYDENKLLELCRGANIETFYLEMSRYAEERFSGAELDEIGERIENYVVSGGTYGTHENQIAVRKGQTNGNLGYAKKRIFVSYRHLKLRYPSLKSRALAPAYQVRRWIDVLRERRGGGLLSEYRATAAVDKETVRDVNTLMKDLKLSAHIK